MSMSYELNLDDEATLIEELNLLQADWRCHYNGTAEAAEVLLPGWRSRYYRGLAESEYDELKFDEEDY